ncbi:MAG: signal peptidase I [Microgenomates group bacterium]
MKILKIIFNSLYWLVIFALVIIAVSTTFSALEIPGGLKALVVQSGSMEPVIKTGSVILIKKQDTYSVGDIISFASGGQGSTTHRVVETEVKNGKEFFYTKGEANQGEDRESVSVDKVLGKTIFIVPYLGYAVAFAKTQKGFIFLIVVPATIIIFSEVLNIKKEILVWREKRKSKEFL